MKIDTLEMQALAVTQPARLDFYAPIHKALRAFMADTLGRLGRLDASDEEELAMVTGQVIGLAQLCQSHLEHEDAYVHPALQARCAGVVDAAAEDHLEHRAACAALVASAEALHALPSRDRAAAALGLYRQLALFVAHNLEHMHHEETQHNAALWKAYTDEELGALHERLVASIPPAEAMLVMRWMIPALCPDERTAVLGGMKQAAPEPAFRAVLETVQPHLDAPAWGKLCRSLGLAPVPGLVG